MKLKITQVSKFEDDTLTSYVRLGTVGRKPGDVEHSVEVHSCQEGYMNPVVLATALRFLARKIGRVKQ